MLRWLSLLVFPEEETQVCDTFNQYSWLLVCYFVVIETGGWTGGGEVNSPPQFLSQPLSEVIVYLSLGFK